MLKDWVKKSKLCVRIYECCANAYYRCRKRTIKKLWHGTYKLRGGRNNPHEKFLVITSNNNHAGIYSNVLDFILPQLEYADKTGRIPVVDLGKYFLPMLQDKNEKGVENPWEYYFLQPNKQYTVEEVYQSKNVRMACDAGWVDWKKTILAGKDGVERWNKIIKEYIFPSASVQSKIDKESKRLLSPDKKVLGVSIRAGYRAGAMRNESLINNHPIVASCEEYIDIVEQKLREWNYAYLFLAIDDREYMEKFKEAFKEKCLYVDRRLKHFFEDGKPVWNNRLIEYEGSSIRETTEDYITETYLLSQCDSLYACMSGSTDFAYLLNGGRYKHVEIYNKGVYTDIKK